MRKKIGNYAKVIFFTLSRWCCCCYRDVMVPFAVVTDIAVSHRQNKFTRYCRINVFVWVLPSLSVAVLDTERLPCHMYVSMYVSPFLPDVWVCVLVSQAKLFVSCCMPSMQHIPMSNAERSAYLHATNRVRMNKFSMFVKSLNSRLCPHTTYFLFPLFDAIWYYTILPSFCYSYK